MRWLAVSILLLVASAPALAATQINGCGKFEVWIPDDWKVAVNGERLTGENDDLYVLVGPLSDKEADLIDEDVTDFVGDELSNVKVTSDRRDKMESLDVRLIEGTGRDDEDEEDVSFRALALNPNADDPVIEVLVYAAPERMNKSKNRAVVERILRSLRPH